MGSEEDRRYLTRRRVLAGAGGVLGADVVGSFLLDTYVHGEIQVLDPEAVCGVAYPPAIQAAASDRLDVHVVSLLEESGKASYNVDAGIDDIERGLGQLDIDADVSGYDVALPADIYGDITGTEVKGAAGPVDAVAAYLEEETAVLDAVAEDDVVVFAGDFDTDLLSYRGTAYDGQYAAVSTAFSDTYTTNQVLHNVGHTLGLPHTYTEDQMTWSVLTELASHEVVIGYGIESRNNWQEAQQAYRDGRSC